MTIKDKVRQYLLTHRAPITMQGLADRYMVSVQGVRSALIELEEEQFARCEKIGRLQYWSINQARPVAVPDEPVQPVRPVRNLWPSEATPEDFAQPTAPRRSTYDRPTVNSYPHVRGFDD